MVKHSENGLIHANIIGLKLVASTTSYCCSSCCCCCSSCCDHYRYRWIHNQMLLLRLSLVFRTTSFGEKVKLFLNVVIPNLSFCFKFKRSQNCYSESFVKETKVCNEKFATISRSRCFHLFLFPFWRTFNLLNCG